MFRFQYYWLNLLLKMCIKLRPGMHFLDAVLPLCSHFFVCETHAGNSSSVSRRVGVDGPHYDLHLKKGLYGLGSVGVVRRWQRQEFVAVKTTKIAAPRQGILP